MKKLISLVLALVLSLSLIACGAKQDDTPQAGADTPDTTQTAEKQKLIVGFDAEFPPFGFIAADGSYDGFDLAMAEELCSRLGWDFEAVPIVWDSKDAELAAGTITASPTPAARMTTPGPTPTSITPSSWSSRPTAAFPPSPTLSARA